MTSANTRVSTAAVVVLAVLGVIASVNASVRVASSQRKEVARGDYIVHHLSMCSDCHGNDLRGAPLPFKPTMNMPWSPVAPNLRNLKTYTQAQLASTLMTGKRPAGIPLLPPMPGFHMNRADATAVAAYIKSLK